MPSAMANNRGPAYTESSLLFRTSPRSERTAYLRVSATGRQPPADLGASSRERSSDDEIRSSLVPRCGAPSSEFHGCLADEDHDARFERNRAGHLRLADVGPVGGPQIFEVPDPVRLADPSMPSRGVVVGQYQGRVVG